MFSSNWFENLAKDNFKNIIKPNFIGVEKINYLEIGCFEGASLTYMFENVLTHCESTATVIDPFIFYENQYNIFNENIKPYMNQINLKKGYSQDILSTLTQDYFDLIYIDGDHTSEGVFNDAILSFPLLKKME
jgi:predicted O-methyltransferase YrrM